MDLAERLLDPQTVEAAIPALVQGIYQNIRANLAVPEMKAAVDTIRELHRRLEAAKADLDAAREELPRAYRERDASIKELAGQLASITAAAREEIARLAEDSARMEAVENLKLTVQHRSGITASVHPWMVRGDVGAWTGRSAREVIDAARAGGTR